MDAPRFTAAGHRSLRNAGLAGEPVAVTFAGKALELSGAASGSLRIEAARIARVRFGYLQGKYHRHFVARIWHLDGGGPLVIEPVERECPAYGAAMRGFAQAVAAARGIAHIERGISGAGALLMLILSMSMVVGFNVTAFVLMDSDLRLGWYALLVVSWALGAVFLWLYFARQRPRALSSLAELEGQLPGPGT